MALITDFLHMAIELIIEKKRKILKMCTEAKLTQTFTIRVLIQLIVILVASIEALSHGRLFIGNLKKIKLNLFNRTKIIWKKDYNYTCLYKKNLLGWKMILWQPQKVKSGVSRCNIIVWNSRHVDQTSTGVIYKQLYINVLGVLEAKLRLLILFKKKYRD